MPKKKTSTKTPTKKKSPTKITPEEILPSLFRSNMLRMVLTKHIELNKSADTKANMLMTAASIVAAVTISASQKAESSELAIILISSLLAIIFAILVIIPKPYHKKTKHGNLLYFRSFREMGESEYELAMKDMMADKDEMYKQYIQDIYHYGAVTLTQKYRLLSIGLVLFLLGLIWGAVGLVLPLSNFS